MEPNKIEFRHGRAQNDFHIVDQISKNAGDAGEIINKTAIDQIQLCAYGDQNGDPQYGVLAVSELGRVIKNKVKKPLPMHVLDEFLKYPEVIPAEWSGKIVCFWGTLPMMDEVIKVLGSKITEEIKTAREFVPCMYNSGGKWVKDFLEVDDMFGPNRLSAELKHESIFRRLLNKILEY